MTGLLPLTHADLASHHGVRAPKAIILFGPPGTGKTTFAKAIASQLGLPFVELFPSQLASAGVGGQAAALRTFFKRVIEADEPIDLDELVRASAQFTPADIDFAARKGAQMAFERSIIGPRTNRSTLEDFLAAIDDTRPTLTRAMVHAFETDIDDYARM